MFIGLTPLGINSVLGSPSNPFTPIALFSAGQQGGWWEPSDFTSLFQDAAGSIPVTAVEQPVAVMLDKRLGLVRGPELVAGQTWSSVGVGAVGGVNNVTFVAATAGSGGASAMIVANKLYEITYTISGITSGSIGLDVGGGAAVQRTANGSYTERKYANASGILTASCAGTTTSGVFTINSCKLINGNHVKVVNSVVSARVNLLTNTEGDAYATNFGGGSIVTKSFLGAGITRLTKTGSSGYAEATIVINSLAGVTVTNNNSIEFRLVTGNPAAIRFGTAQTEAPYTTVVQTVSSLGVPSADGIWRRINVAGTITPGASGTLRVAYFSFDLANDNVIEVRFPQTEGGSVSTTYQRVNTPTDYNTVGFPKYLTFNGTTSAAQTFGSVDFTATDKMTVVVGVRKLSDATVGVVAELSTNSDALNGTFALQVPSGYTADAFFIARGTSGVFSKMPAPSPTTKVITGISDISGNSVNIRLNGVAGTAATGLGTGNFGNYPLFIGARNAASLFFNGNLYDLIVRGAASTAGEVAATEMYVNSKTGAY